MVTSANDNANYHLSNLERTSITVQQIKAFKKWYEAEPDPEVEDEEADADKEPDESQRMCCLVAVDVLEDLGH